MKLDMQLDMPNPILTLPGVLGCLKERTETSAQRQARMLTCDYQEDDML